MDIDFNKIIKKKFNRQQKTGVKIELDRTCYIEHIKTKSRAIGDERYFDKRKQSTGIDSSTSV